jgi:Transcription factor WhiB
MTGLPAAQPNHSLATAHAPAQVAVWPPGVPAPALVGSWAWARVIRQARCAESSLDADVWFPVSPGAQQARQEAAAAIAICKDCPVRSQCLALSLRHWDVGQYGVWGGMVAAERASLRRQMLADRADALRYFTDAAGLPSYRSRSLIDAVRSSPLAKRGVTRQSSHPVVRAPPKAPGRRCTPAASPSRGCGGSPQLDSASYRACQSHRSVVTEASSGLPARTVVSASPFPGCGGWPLPIAPPLAGTRWPGSRQSARRNRHQRAWRS